MDIDSFSNLDRKLSEGSLENFNPNIIFELPVIDVISQKIEIEEDLENNLLKVPDGILNRILNELRNARYYPINQSKEIEKEFKLGDIRILYYDTSFLSIKSGDREIRKQIFEFYLPPLHGEREVYFIFKPGKEIRIERREIGKVELTYTPNSKIVLAVVNNYPIFGVIDEKSGKAVFTGSKAFSRYIESGVLYSSMREPFNVSLMVIDPNTKKVIYNKDHFFTFI